MIFVEIEPYLGGGGNVFLYGHYDKQPPMDPWDIGGAYEPTVVGDKMYCRGCADDGYSIYGSMAVFAYLQANRIPHGRASLIIEGGEESGSVDLDYFLELLSPEIGMPNLIICLDSGSGNYEQFFVTTSLRGGITGHVGFDVLTQATHSGSTGGLITDSFRAARRLLDRVESSDDGTILLNGFNVPIPQNRIDEAEVYASVIGEGIYNWIPFQPGVQPPIDDVVELVLAKTWMPTLTITGADGLPSIQSAGNVIRTNTDLKFSFRLPPTANSSRCLDEFIKVIEQTKFVDGLIKFRTTPTGYNGWNAASFEAWLTEAIEEASQRHFNNSALYTGEGGSIPFIGALQDRYPQAQFIVTGVLGPNSQAHGKNEFLHLTYAQKLSSVLVDIVIASSFHLP